MAASFYPRVGQRRRRTEGGLWRPPTFNFWEGWHWIAFQNRNQQRERWKYWVISKKVFKPIFNLSCHMKEKIFFCETLKQLWNKEKWARFDITFSISKEISHKTAMGHNGQLGVGQECEIRLVWAICTRSRNKSKPCQFKTFTISPNFLCLCSSKS